MVEERRKWLLQVRQGTRFLFWVILFTPFLNNVGIIPYLLYGGSQGERVLSWMTWSAAVAIYVMKLGMLIGGYLVSRPLRCSSVIAVNNISRQVLRICVISLFLMLVYRWGVAIGFLPRFALVLGGGGLILNTAGAFCLFQYFEGLMENYGRKRLARFAGVVKWFAGFAYVIPYIVLNHVVVNAVLPLVSSNTAYWLISGFRVCVGVVVLWLLWRIGSALVLAAEGKCVGCGYSLEGLVERRCPECGLSC